MNKTDKVLISVFLLVFLAVSGFIINSGNMLSEVQLSQEAVRYDRKPALVNINTASEYQLAGIGGVGDTIAGRIVQYRTTNGPFKTTEEIKEVKGIGDATYEKIKDYITVEGE